MDILEDIADGVEILGELLIEGIEDFFDPWG